MATLLLMCGVAFSGKTTLARRFVDELGAVYVSLDAINAERGLWGGEGISVQEWERTHQIALERVRDALTAQRPVVVDDTNNLRWLRDRFRGVAGEGGHATRVVYLDTPMAEVARRMQRSRETGDRRLVDDDVLQELVASFEVPGPGEDRVVVRSSDDLAPLLEQLRGG